MPWHCDLCEDGCEHYPGHRIRYFIKRILTPLARWVLGDQIRDFENRRDIAQSWIDTWINRYHAMRAMYLSKLDEPLGTQWVDPHEGSTFRRCQAAPIDLNIPANKPAEQNDWRQTIENGSASSGEES